MRWFFSWEFLSILPERLVFWIAFSFERAVTGVLGWLRQINPVKSVKLDSSDMPGWLRKTILVIRLISGFSLMAVVGVAAVCIALGGALLIVLCGILGTTTLPDTTMELLHLQRGWNVPLLVLYSIVTFGILVRVVLILLRLYIRWPDRHKWFVLYDKIDKETEFSYRTDSDLEFHGRDNLPIFYTSACPFRRWSNRVEVGGPLGRLGWQIEIRRARALTPLGVRERFWLISENRDSQEGLWLCDQQPSPAEHSLLSAIIHTNAVNLPHLQMCEVETRKKAVEKEIGRILFLHSVLCDLKDYYGPEYRTNQRDRDVHNELTRVLKRFNDGRLDPENNGLDFSLLPKIKKRRQQAEAAAG